MARHPAPFIEDIFIVVPYTGNDGISLWQSQIFSTLRGKKGTFSKALTTRAIPRNVFVNSHLIVNAF